MYESDQIAADFTTLYRQASMTAEGYLQKAISSIDEALGEGYAAEHPELIAAFMATAASDCNTAVSAKVNSAALREIADSINTLSMSIDRISDSIDGVSAAIES